LINIKLEDGVMKFSESFRIKDGKSTHRWNSKLGQFLTTLDDGEYECTVQPLEMTKTLEQNKYFNGVLVQVFMSETGYSFRDCKSWLKKEFGEKVMVTDPLTGDRSLETKSQASYTLKEMNSLIDKSEQFLRHDLGLQFPTSEEYKQMTAEERSKLK